MVRSRRPVQPGVSAGRGGIGNILVSTPEGARIPLKQLATISEQTGAFIVYRENNERYIPIKFSVRGRDLEGTVKDAQQRLAHMSRCLRVIALSGMANLISFRMKNDGSPKSYPSHS